LVPPVAEQLGVERAAQEPRPAALLAVGVQALRNALHEPARVAPREHERLPVPVRAPAVVPGPQVVDGPAVVVAVQRVGRIALRVPYQADQLPVHRDGYRAGAGRDRLELVEGAEAERVGLVDAERAHAVLGQLALEPRAVAALGEPEAAPEGPEAALVRADPGADLDPQSR